MENDIDIIQGPLNRDTIHQVALNKFDPTAQAGHILTIACAQVVEYAYWMAALDERLGKMRTDESRAASNQLYAHRNEDTRRAAQPLRSRENKCRYSSRRTGGEAPPCGASSSMTSTGLSRSGTWPSS
jgi:hypothetical protein